jgi:hypothetical protein
MNLFELLISGEKVLCSSNERLEIGFWSWVFSRPLCLYLSHPIHQTAMMSFAPADQSVLGIPRLALIGM